MIASRKLERKRMDEARATRSQTAKRTIEARAKQRKRTWSGQVSEQMVLRVRK